MEQKKKRFVKLRLNFVIKKTISYPIKKKIFGIFKLGNNQKFFFTYCRCAEKTFKFSAVNKS